MTDYKHRLFSCQEEEQETRSALSKDDNLVLNFLLTATTTDGQYQYTERQIDSYIDLMHDGVDVRSMLNARLSAIEIYSLGGLIDQGIDITGYAEMLDKMDWLDVERELLNRQSVPTQKNSFREKLLATYPSAYVDRQGDVRIKNPKEHRMFLLAEGLSEAEADQIVNDAKLFGAYRRKF